MKKVIVIVLLLGVASAMLLYLDPELRSKLEDLLQSSGLQSTSTTVYKWQDTHGSWQYTQSRPPEGTPYERVEARSDVNVLPLPERLKNK